MSEQKVLCTHVLTIRFDQFENNRVTWCLEPDDMIMKTSGFSLADLAESGAPLAALGIRALLKLCADGLVYNALEQANGIQEAFGVRRLSRQPGQQIEIDPGPSQGKVTIN